MKNDFRQIFKNQKVVIFDGECILCNRFFQFLIRYDKHKTLRFATLQTFNLTDFQILHIHAKTIPESVIFIDNLKVYFKSNASIRITASLGGFWKMVLIAMVIPRFIRDKCYDLMARNRYRWWGKTHCYMPDADLRSRFINVV